MGLAHAPNTCDPRPRAQAGLGSTSGMAASSLRRLQKCPTASTIHLIGAC